jgi:ActR/RegA family two-component response regulator
VDRLLHELRSTLARLKAEIELLDPGPGAGAASLSAIRSSLDDVLALVTDLETATSPPPSGLAQDVVIVDDDSRLATAMARQMSRLGFAAVALPGLEGLASLVANGARVVIDLSVLRRGGFDDLNAVRRLRPIVMSGSADPLARLEAASYGATAFLMKPVSPESVALAMRDARDGSLQPEAPKREEPSS